MWYPLWVKKIKTGMGIFRTNLALPPVMVYGLEVLLSNTRFLPHGIPMREVFICLGDWKLTSISRFVIKLLWSFPCSKENLKNSRMFWFGKIQIHPQNCSGITSPIRNSSFPSAKELRSYLFSPLQFLENAVCRHRQMANENETLF